MLKLKTAQPVLQRFSSTMNDHLIVVFLLAMIVLTSLLLAFLSAFLEVSKPTEWWGGWLLVEFSRVIAVVILLTRFFTVYVRRDTVQYKLFQQFFLRRLARSESQRDRQYILDRMMLENLLEQAELSGAKLSEVHLEGANLKQIRLWRADLFGADLESAHLQNAWLGETNFSYAKLTSTNLRGAELQGSNLERANLANANLCEVNFTRADLRDASLYDAELQHACLNQADLSGSNLLYANLLGASLQNTRFSETTVLPDGTYWTEETDLSRFTMPQHPDFVAYVGPDAVIFKERTARNS